MRMVLMCPKCGLLRFVEFNDVSHMVCDYCSTKRTDIGETVEMRKIDDEGDRELFVQRIHRKYLFNNPEFDETAYEARLKKREDFMRGMTERNANRPKCPICQSTNIHKISGVNKVGSALMFGVFAAGHVSKTYKCDNCGSKF